MSVTEKLEKALNDFMGEINERLDNQKTMVFDVEQLAEQAFGAGAKAAAKLIKTLRLAVCVVTPWRRMRWEGYCRTTAAQKAIFL